MDIDCVSASHGRASAFICGVSSFERRRGGFGRNQNKGGATGRIVAAGADFGA